MRQRGQVEAAFKAARHRHQVGRLPVRTAAAETINVGSVDFGYVGDARRSSHRRATRRSVMPPLSPRAATTRRSLVRRIRRSGSRRSEGQRSPSARVRALTICWSPRSERPTSPGRTSSPYRWRRRRHRRLHQRSGRRLVDLGPHVALAELKFNARAIASGSRGSIPPMPSTSSALGLRSENIPALVARLNETLAAGRPTGPIRIATRFRRRNSGDRRRSEAVRRRCRASTFAVGPVTDEVIITQQKVADRFARLG